MTYTIAHTHAKASALFNMTLMLVWVASIPVFSDARGANPRGEDVPREIAPIDAPFEMPVLTRPEFPDHTFDVRDYGAKGLHREELKDIDFSEFEHTQNNTRAIHEAIEAAHEAGGGRVLIPQGQWVTGPIHLRSDVNLHISEGAVLHFSENVEDYLPVVKVRYPGVEAYNYSPLIYARDVENVAITGKGILDGHGEPWWKWYEEWKQKNGFPFGAKCTREDASKQPLGRRMMGKGADIEGMRPTFITFFESKNILVEGITLKDSPTWNIHPVYSENIIIRDVTVKSLNSKNGDGVNPDSSKNVLIEYCRFDTGDDAIAIKSGLNEDGLNIDIPSENIVIRHYEARNCQWGIAIGSEMSGGVRNIYIHDGYHEGTGRGFNFKGGAGRGNVVENIYIENIKMKDIVHGAVNFYNTSYGRQATGPVPLYRNFNISNIRVDGAGFAIGSTGHPKKWIETIHFEDIHVENADRGVGITRMKGLTMKNVTIKSKQRAMVLNDVSEASLKDLTLEGKGEALLVKGSKSESIVVEGLEIGEVRCAEDVPDDTVTVDGVKLP